ncbi:hypothetical protein C4K68_07720 [Pokkaliibacter plantistimulans]|uniref:Uncharacterized protein n=1 Tax=Proteobacteria bacterium 228 TaxID=2083153 RepID=A0A2S5KTE2_9PROT|nr:hypothetical protein [Pokkaliibacter plantistimulans]PPC77925.1 hypothetical protein C4K68_07720 [Pokkaliibacter plantistimulans]
MADADYNAIRTGIIQPALTLLPEKMRSPQAEVMLLAIGGQESRLHYRHQIGGPAHGLWQFEQGGGVKGVLEHKATRAMAAEVCAARQVPPTIPAVYAAIEFDDVLACCFARLLLWTDPGRLPNRTEESLGWTVYQRNWRPGQPHPQTWPTYWGKAVGSVYGEQA